MAGISVKIGADASEFQKAMAGVKGEISSFKNMVGGLAAGAAAIYGISKAFSAVGDAMRQSSQAAAGMEMLQISFETLTGNADKARQMIDDFRQEAQKSPLSTADYADAAKRLMAFGVNADDVIPILKQLGDVSMGNADQFAGLSLAFGQVMQKGRLMGGEVIQLSERGFNPLQLIAKRTGETMLQLQKRMEDGGVSTQEVRDALRDATSAGGLFFRAIDRGAATMEGKIAQFNDTILSLKVAFGEGLNVGLKQALDKASGELSKFEEVAQRFGAVVGDALSQAVSGNTQKIEQLGGVIMAGILAGMKNMALATGAIGLEAVIGKWHDFVESNRKMIGLDPQGGMFKRPTPVGPAAFFSDAIKQTLDTGRGAINSIMPQGALQQMQQTPTQLQQTAADFNAGIDAGYRALLERQTRATEEMNLRLKLMVSDFN